MFNCDRNRRECAANDGLFGEAPPNISLYCAKAFRRCNSLKLRIDLHELGIELLPQARARVVTQKCFERAWAYLRRKCCEPVPIGALNCGDPDSKLGSPLCSQGDAGEGSILVSVFLFG